MATFGDFDLYIADLCAKHKKILHTEAEPHYFHFGLDQILTGLTSEVNYPYVSRERNEYNYLDNKADSYFKVKDLALNFIDVCSDSTDYALKQQKLDVLEAIIDDFVNKMQEDSIDHNHLFLKDFDLNKVEVTEIEQAANNAFGYFVRIVFLNSHNVSINEDNWV